jgi:Tfp pilus assembly protein PilF
LKYELRVKMNINKVIKLAFEYHGKGDLKQAEYFYKKILKKDLDNPDVFHMLGVLFSQLGNYDSAIRYIRKALQFNPSFPKAYCNLGVTFQEKGQLDEAVTKPYASHGDSIHLLPYGLDRVRYYVDT